MSFILLDPTSPKSWQDEHATKNTLLIYSYEILKRFKNSMNMLRSPQNTVKERTIDKLGFFQNTINC